MQTYTKEQVLAEIQRRWPRAHVFLRVLDEYSDGVLVGFVHSDSQLDVSRNLRYLNVWEESLDVLDNLVAIRNQRTPKDPEIAKLYPRIDDWFTIRTLRSGHRTIRSGHIFINTYTYGGIVPKAPAKAHQ